MKILAPPLVLTIHNWKISCFWLFRMQVVWVELCLNFLCSSQKNFLASLQNFYNEVVSNRKRGKPQWHNVKTLPWWWSLGKRFLLKHVFVQELVQSRRPNPYHWFNIFWNILWKQTQHCRLNICQYNRYIETAVMSRKHCQRHNGPNGCVHLPE